MNFLAHQLIKPTGVTIMMGVPRSGKSTFLDPYAESSANTLNTPHAFLLSADTYRMKNGKYVWDPKDRAHAKCFFEATCIIAQVEMVDPENAGVVIDNTNLRNWERAPYAALAQAWNRPLTFIHIDTPLDQVLERSNAHNVPNDVITNMYGRWEEPEAAWRNDGAEYYKVRDGNPHRIW